MAVKRLFSKPQGCADEPFTWTEKKLQRKPKHNGGFRA